MADFEALYREAEQIQAVIECICSDDPNELYNRLADLNVYLARTSQMYAEAKHLMNLRRAQVFREEGELLSTMPATIANKYIEAASADEGKLTDWVERLNRAIVHQSDNIRSMFSYIKEQIKLTKHGY